LPQKLQSISCRRLRVQRGLLLQGQQPRR
jgi:hypothetical protein